MLDTYRTCRAIACETLIIWNWANMTLNDLNYENTSGKDFGLFRLTQEIDYENVHPNGSLRFIGVQFALIFD